MGFTKLTAISPHTTHFALGDARKGLEVSGTRESSQAWWGGQGKGRAREEEECTEEGGSEWQDGDGKVSYTSHT